MAVKQFINLSNLDLYDSLLKDYIAAEDAKSIKTVAIDGYNLKFYDVEEPVNDTPPKYNITLPQPDLSNFVQRVIEGSNGKALIFNESDGGGAKFEHNDGTLSFVGVNDGGENGLTGQIYSVKKIDDKYVGTRINMTTNGFYYVKGDSSAYTADDELATKGDLKGDAASKTIYLKDESSGQSEYAKIYRIYQGADSIDMSKNVIVGSIDIPKDMVVRSGSIGTVVTPDEPYEGAVPGDKYIDLEIQNQSEHLYIPANSLVDIYTAAQGASEVQLAISATNEISASIVAINGSKLVDGSVTRAKLASDVIDSLDLADSALQQDDIDSVADSDIEALFG